MGSAKGAKGGVGDNSDAQQFLNQLMGQGIQRLEASYKNLGLWPSTMASEDIGAFQAAGEPASVMLQQANAPTQLAQQAANFQQSQQQAGTNAFNQGAQSVPGTQTGTQAGTTAGPG